jgi:O-antigen ligase
MFRSAIQFFRSSSSFKSPIHQLVFFALTGSIASALVSIAASQILLGLALIGWIVTLKREELKGVIHFPFFPPLCAFFLWTVLSSILAPNTLSNLALMKKFFLFAPLFLAPTIIRGEKKLIWIYQAVFAFSAVSGISGVIQYYANPNRDLLNRISGFSSHWMTYSGLLMLALAILIAYAFAVRRSHYIWIIPLGSLLAAAIVLSETRTAIAGAMAGAFVIMALKKPRAIFALLAIAAIFFIASPRKIAERFQSSEIRQDPRVEIWGTSLRLIKENPWFGVGLRNVKSEALRYRGNRLYPDWGYQHMHNNFLQIAAERGIPGLMLWLWLMARLGWDALALFRASRKASPNYREASLASLGALGALTALIIAGVGEYNFGDSEILVLFLFLMSAPYAFLSNPQSPSATPNQK